MNLRHVFAAGVIALGAAVSTHGAQAATLSYDFSGFDGSEAVTASFTVDVVNGNAISGTGSLVFSGPGALTSLGTVSLSLVTLNTPNVHDLGGGNLSFRYGGGTDLIGDTQVPIDGNGLVFAVATPSNPALDVGFNLWSNGGSSYTGFVAGNSLTAGGPSIYEGFNGTVSAVPLPGGLMLFGAGLVGLGAFGWQRSRRKAA